MTGDIEVRELSSLSVSSDGTAFRIGARDGDGGEHRQSESRRSRDQTAPGRLTLVNEIAAAAMNRSPRADQPGTPSSPGAMDAPAEPAAGAGLEIMSRCLNPGAHPL
jgi:hypothetical protein